MDARALIGAVCALGLAIASVRAQEITDANWDAVRLESERGLDAATLVELESLLESPVDLNTGDLAPLQVVPWLTPAQLDTLSARRPVGSLDELGRLPGWSADEARRLAPFVRLDAPRRARLGGRLHATPTTAQMRLDGARWGVAGGYRAGQERPSGHATFRTARSSVLAGVLRAKLGQGLLVWSGDATPSAGTLSWRHGMALGGAASAGSAHAVRGAGLEWRSRRARTMFLVGDASSGRTLVGAVEVAIVERWTLQLAATRVGTQAAGSVGCGRQATDLRAVCEVGGTPERLGVAAAVELGPRRARLAARWQATPAGHAAPLAGMSAAARRAATREARFAAWLERGGLDCMAGVAQTLRREPSGARRTTDEAAVELRHRRGTAEVVLGATRRARREEILGDEGIETGRRESRTLRGRWRRALAPPWSVAVEGRSGNVEDDSTAGLWVWRAALARTSPLGKVELALGSFRAAPGQFASERLPGQTGGGALRGDGMRVALRAEVVRRGIEVDSGVACTWTVRGAPRLEAGVALQARLP